MRKCKEKSPVKTGAKSFSISFQMMQSQVIHTSKRKFCFPATTVFKAPHLTPLQKPKSPGFSSLVAFLIEILQINWQVMSIMPSPKLIREVHFTDASHLLITFLSRSGLRSCHYSPSKHPKGHLKRREKKKKRKRQEERRNKMQNKNKKRKGKQKQRKAKGVRGDLGENPKGRQGKIFNK